MRILQLLAVTTIGVGLCAFNGCGSTATTEKPDEHAEGDGHEHGHAEHGPNEEGHLIELGNEEYHAELAHDDDSHRVTIYILDSAAKKNVPIEEGEVTINLTVDGKPQQFKLPAKPMEGESQGKASRFEVSDETLCHAVCEDPNAKGRLNVTIDGKPYVGDITHADHDHEHAHEKEQKPAESK